MEDHQFEEGEKRDVKQLIRQCEEMLTSDKQYFFEQANFEQILEFYEDRQEFVKALEVADIASSQHPFSSVIMTKKAQLLFELKKYKRSLELLEKAEVLDPADMNIYLQYADVFTAQHKYPEALENLSIAREMADKDELDDIYLEFADVYEEMEDFKMAFKYVGRALTLNPKHDEALTRVNFICDLSKNYEASVELHEKLINKHPYGHQLWFNQAYAYFKLKLYKKAVNSLDYALVIDEKDSASQLLMGDAYYKLMDHERALSSYMESLHNGKPNKHLLYKIGRCLEQRNDMIKARYYYRKAVKMNNKYEKALYRIAATYQQEQRFVEAASVLEDLTELNAKKTQYWRSLSTVYFEMDDLARSLEAGNEIIKLGNSKPEDWILYCHCQVELEGFAKTLETLELASDLISVSPELTYYKSAFLFALGRQKEAIIELESALSMDYRKFELLFDALPELEHNAIVISIIGQFKNKV